MRIARAVPRGLIECGTLQNATTQIKETTFHTSHSRSLYLFCATRILSMIRQLLRCTCKVTSARHHFRTVSRGTIPLPHRSENHTRIVSHIHKRCICSTSSSNLRSSRLLIARAASTMTAEDAITYLYAVPSQTKSGLQSIEIIICEVK